MDLSRALQVIASGGCLVYPTETLYALGADGTCVSAAAHIYLLKGRDPAKPLPLIIAGLDQLDQVTLAQPPDLERLAELFWPGPLSVLVPTRPGLPAVVSDQYGLTSVRVTSHHLAARLCREAGRPLIATSANLSGHLATARLADLDPELLGRVDCVVEAGPRPAGGPPSTVVGLLGGGVLAVHRQGAVSLDALRHAGFDPRSV